MTWLVDALAFAREHWEPLLGSGAVGSVAMKIWDRIGEKARRKVEREQWEIEQSTQRAQWEQQQQGEQIKMLYPQRHEAFGAFMTKIENLIEVITDQQGRGSSRTREEACDALYKGTREAQMLLVTKFSIVAPPAMPICAQLITDLYNLVDLGADPRISWNNPLVAQLFDHVGAVQKVFAQALITDKIVARERPQGWEQKVFAVTDDPQPEIRLINLPPGGIKTSVWSKDPL